MVLMNTSILHDVPSILHNVPSILHNMPMCTLLHIVKNACIHQYHMEIKQSDKAASNDFDSFLADMRTMAQDFATHAKTIFSESLYCVTTSPLIPLL